MGKTSQPTILVTGCSSGIGAHCIRRLREDGWRVFATARKDADLARLRADGFEAFYLDYREQESIHTVFEAVMAAADGRLDALFNNGGYSQAGAVEDVPLEALREQFECNVFGWHTLTRLVIPVMRRAGKGHIVHNSSVLALVPMPLRGAYNASKFALDGLMLTCRMELEGSGVHVSVMNTGPIPSKIAENAIPYIEKHIDIESSVHADAYAKRLAQLKAGGTADRGDGAEPCYKALKSILASDNPHAHYLVTRQTKLAALGKRILPADLFYRLLAKSA